MQGPGQLAGSTHMVEMPLILHGRILVVPACLTFHALGMQMNQNNKSVLTRASIAGAEELLEVTANACMAMCP